MEGEFDSRNSRQDGMTQNGLLHAMRRDLYVLSRVVLIQNPRWIFAGMRKIFAERNLPFPDEAMVREHKKGKGRQVVGIE